MATPADEPLFRADRNSIWSLMRSSSRRRATAASTSISSAIRLRAAGARLDYPQFLANWQQNFHGWNAGDFGWGADRIETFSGGSKTANSTA